MTEQSWPQAFLQRMKKQLGTAYPDFLRALDEPPFRGLRLQVLKTPQTDFWPWEHALQVPWEPNGRYLAADDPAGVTGFHEAGAFYLQEPSAMLPARMLAARPGETVLDLCAAPGGKSTQIAVGLQGKGLLVANEIVPKRAMILSRNIERLGIPNALVVSSPADELARRWPEGFDAVMVDAPCSGEGMFRRDAAAVSQWREEMAAGCVKRQREILAAAAELVRPGGRMVYATCTWNPAENEENIDWFLQKFPFFRLEPFDLPGVDGSGGFVTCYPHCLQGEGQFAALLRRDGNGEAHLPANRDLPQPARQERQLIEGLFAGRYTPARRLGTTLVTAPFLPDTEGLKVLRAGLHLGEIRSGLAFPDHAAAVAFGTPAAQVHICSDSEAEAFFAGQTIPGGEKGWTVAVWRGLALGWAKGSGGVLKNHYPKGLRNTRILCSSSSPERKDISL